MLEMLGLGEYLPYAKLAVVVCGVCIAIIVAAAASFLLQTTLKPLLLVVQWLVCYTPGKPGEVAKGVSFGLRIVVWAAFIGFGMWMFCG